MSPIRRAALILSSLMLVVALLGAGPIAAQEATPASEADRALLHAATGQLFSADSLLIVAKLQLIISKESAESADQELAASGQIALDMVAKQGSVDFSYELNGALAGLEFILSGDQVYLNTAEEWFLLSPLGKTDSEDDSSAAAITIDLGSLGELWRLPAAGSLIQLRSTVNLLAIATDPELSATLVEILSIIPADLLGLTGLTGEEIVALLPLLSVILQEEPRIETTYGIDPDSGDIEELIMDLELSLNPALLGSVGEPTLITFYLKALLSQDAVVEIGALPQDAPVLSLDELLASLLH